MPPKPEYWILTKEQFTKFKSQINELGQKLLTNLQANGFTKITSWDDWLGVSVEMLKEDILTFVCFSLIRESPQEFRLILRSWNINNPSGTCVDLYEKIFNTIEEYESSFTDESKRIKSFL